MHKIRHSRSPNRHMKKLVYLIKEHIWLQPKTKNKETKRKKNRNPSLQYQEDSRSIGFQSKSMNPGPHDNPCCFHNSPYTHLQHKYFDVQTWYLPPRPWQHFWEVQSLRYTNSHTISEYASRQDQSYHRSSACWRWEPGYVTHWQCSTL